MTNHSTSEKGQGSFAEKYRWYFLIIAALTSFGPAFNVGSVSTLQVQFQNYLHLDELEYAHIAQVSAIPGFFVPVLMGTIGDYYGPVVPVAIGLIFSFCGQLFVTLAVTTKSFPLLFLGAACKHASSESMGLGRNKMIRMWFKDNQIGKVTGMLLVSGSIGTMACDIFYPTVYESTQSLAIPYIIGTGVLSISMVTGAIMIYMYKRLVQVDDLQEEQGVRHLSIREIKYFPKVFFFLVIASVISMISFHNTKMYESKFLQTRFGFRVSQAGYILCVGLIFSGISGPLTGFLMDAYGSRTMFLIGSIGIATLGVFGNAALPSCDQCFLPIIPLICMSLGNGMKHVIVLNSIMMLIKVKNIGIAVAIFSTTSSCTSLVFSWVNGYIAHKTIKQHGYFWVYICNTLLGCIAMMLALIAHMADSKSGRNLQRIARPEDEVLKPLPPLATQYTPINESEDELIPKDKKQPLPGETIVDADSKLVL